MYVGTWSRFLTTPNPGQKSRLRVLNNPYTDLDKRVKSWDKSCPYFTLTDNFVVTRTTRLSQFWQWLCGRGSWTQLERRNTISELSVKIFLNSTINVKNYDTETMNGKVCKSKMFTKMKIVGHSWKNIVATRDTLSLLFVVIGVKCPILLSVHLQLTHQNLYLTSKHWRRVKRTGVRGSFLI